MYLISYHLMSRDQIIDFLKPKGAYRWKWMWKIAIKRCMSYYTVLAEHKKKQDIKEKILAFINNPESVKKFMKTFDYEESKFKTITHSDLWTSQIMFALNEDGESN